MSNSIVLKLEHSNQPQSSPQGCKISKIVSGICPGNFVKLIRFADNKVNPRAASKGKITDSIVETLEGNPELYWFKTKGLLLATESCEILERNRIRISFSNPEFEGIMDGGHNALAVATFLLDKLFGVNPKNWEECKNFWEDHFDEIQEKYNERCEEFGFTIPVEIIFPNGEDGSDLEFFDTISEICSARNNNVQLKETAKGNKVGLYDYLKDSISPSFPIVWKTGEVGKIQSQDVISLAVIPLLFLKEKGMLPDNKKSVNKISIYSGKGKCVEFFNEVLQHKNVSDFSKGSFIIQDERIKSSLALIEDILYFFDLLYVSFPDLYHRAAPGKFGRISAVDNNKKSKAPFGTIADPVDYLYPQGYIFPLVAGLDKLMHYDESSGQVSWKINPRRLDLNLLNLSQYVELIKMVNFDPQKVGKGIAFYNQAEAIFEKLTA
jgi:hypothetical protein